MISGGKDTKYIFTPYRKNYPFFMGGSTHFLVEEIFNFGIAAVINRVHLTKADFQFNSIQIVTAR